MALRLQVFMDDRRGHTVANNLELQRRVNDWFDNQAPIAPVDIGSVYAESTVQSKDSAAHFIMYDVP